VSSSSDPTRGCLFFRRVVWIKDGNVWRSEINWDMGEIIKHQQVTHVGRFSFQDMRRVDLPVFWSGNHLFIDSGFDPQKPLVRIDLVSGQIDELDWLMYEGKSIAKKRVITRPHRSLSNWRCSSPVRPATSRGAIRSSWP